MNNKLNPPFKVKYAEGFSKNVRHELRDRIGEAVSLSRDGTCYRVKWPGRESLENVSIGFLVIDSEALPLIDNPTNPDAPCEIVELREEVSALNKQRSNIYDACERLRSLEREANNEETVDLAKQIASLTTLLSIEKKNVSTALGNYEILKEELDGVKNKLDECQQSRMSLLDMIANYKP